MHIWKHVVFIFFWPTHLHLQINFLLNLLLLMVYFNNQYLKAYLSSVFKLF